MPVPVGRMVRVNKLLHQALAELLHRRWRAEAVAITITGVETSPDLYDAQVSYSVLTDDKAGAVDFFRKHKGVIAKALSAEIVLKRMPRLHFIYDPTLKDAARVERLLNEMEVEQTLPKPGVRTGKKN